MRADDAKNFDCKFCGRKFARLEHLQRHTRTHTKEKPFKCTCGRSFARADLLKRHRRLTHNAESRSSTSTFTEHPNGTEDEQDDDVTITTGEDVQRRVLGDLHPTEEMNQETPKLQQSRNHLTDIEVSVHSVNEDQGILAAGGATQISPYLPDTDPASMIEYQQDNDVDLLKDFTDFTVNAGLVLDYDSCIFFPEADLEVEETSGPLCLGSGHDPGHLSAGETPQFETRHAASDKVQSENMSALVAEPDLALHPSWKVSDERRRNLLRNLAPFVHLLPGFVLPSRYTLSRYYKSYVDQWNKHFPFIHVATMRIDESPPELALALAAIGAQYRFESKSGLSLYEASKAIVFERLKHEGIVTGSGPTAGLAKTNVSSHTSQLVNHTEHIDLIRTLIVLIGYSTWDWKVDLLHDAFYFHDTLTRYIRHEGLEESSSSCDQDWHSWIEDEGRRRTKLAAFACLNVQALTYNLSPSILSNEVELPLPCSTAEWEASSAADWTRTREHHQAPAVSFQNAMRALLDRSQDPTLQRALANVSPLGNYIILQALVQRITLLRQLSFPAGALLRMNDVEDMEYSLQKWKQAWQRAPGSSLDPQNPDGSLPFISVAFLSVAFIRLHVDFSVHRKLHTRDPGQIAKAMFDAPSPRRGRCLTTALLHATHALSLPVKMGVQYVSRSHVFFWSCQHALCSLESGLFLCKWLQSIAATSHCDSLTDHERNILSWLRSLVKEAAESVDPAEMGFSSSSSPLDLDPHRLSTVVLRIWALIHGKNALWMITNHISASFMILADQLEAQGV